LDEEEGFGAEGRRDGAVDVDIDGEMEEGGALSGLDDDDDAIRGKGRALIGSSADALEVDEEGAGAEGKGPQNDAGSTFDGLTVVVVATGDAIGDVVETGGDGVLDNSAAAPSRAFPFPFPSPPSSSSRFKKPIISFSRSSLSATFPNILIAAFFAPGVLATTPLAGLGVLVPATPPMNDIDIEKGSMSTSSSGSRRCFFFRGLMGRASASLPASDLRSTPEFSGVSSRPRLPSRGSRTGLGE